MKGKIASALLVIGLFLGAVLVPALAAQGDDLMVVEGNRVYLVKPGDTLAGIAARVHGDPKRWKEIWQLNPQVNKPGLIYPGDTLVIGAAPAEAVAETGAVPPAAVEAVIAPEEYLDELREEPAPFVPFTAAATSASANYPDILYESCGYIASELPAAMILGSPDGKPGLSRFDTVFVNVGDQDGMVAGQEFRILHPVRQVRHPATRAPLGWLVKVVGRLRLDCLQRATATGVIFKSYDLAMTGDRLELYTPPPVPADNFLSPKLAGPCVPGTEGVAARIVATQDSREWVAEGDIIYLDRGMGDGIAPGSRLAIYREKSPEHCCRHLVGEAKVLVSMNGTATALVTNSIGPVKAKDRLTTW